MCVPAQLRGSAGRWCRFVGLAVRSACSVRAALPAERGSGAGEDEEEEAAVLTGWRGLNMATS